MAKIVQGSWRGSSRNGALKAKGICYVQKGTMRQKKTEKKARRGCGLVLVQECPVSGRSRAHRALLVAAMQHGHDTNSLDLILLLYCIHGKKRKLSGIGRTVAHRKGATGRTCNVPCVL
jgi:hypothetical protein